MASQSHADAPGGSRPGTKDLTAAQVQALVVSSLDADKAEDVVCIDLRGKSPVSDVMIIASGRSHRHVGALAEHVLRTLKKAGLGKVAVEGQSAADWVLIDAGDVILHLFRPQVRDFYNLEKIWSVAAPAAADGAPG